ncbi:flagellar protein [Oceanobacillus bengalensis]|uniref:Flagellar protein n=2 Tax=Oceanobacillus bengalensis TaxID=1435466 RepID=A0A494Z4W7_9BACI|nr:flagellar protein [Oceanobacillus bengalensis]
MLFSSPFVHSVHANPTNVLDWIEEDADEEKQEEVNELEPNETDTVVEQVSSSDSLAFNIVRMIFALLLVLALIFVISKLLGRKNKLFNQVKAMENLGGINVGTNKSIQIVRIGTKLYLIGVGENVELLQEITEKELIDQLMMDNSSESQDSILSMFKPKTDGDTNRNSNTDFKKLFSKELTKLKQNREKLVAKQKEDHHE